MRGSVQEKGKTAWERACQGGKGCSGDNGEHMQETEKASEAESVLEREVTRKAWESV